MTRSEKRGKRGFTLMPIGIIHSPFTQINGTPIQPAYAKGIEGRVEVFPDYTEGLRDIEGFERIWLLYWFDRAAPSRLLVVPFLDTIEHGLFATRAPCRPNPIGLSCVRVREVKGNRIVIEGVDILDGTPLLDIKPYVPISDSFPKSANGWLANARGERTVSDERFADRRGRGDRSREERKLRRNGTHDKRRG